MFFRQPFTSSHIFRKLATASFMTITLLITLYFYYYPSSIREKELNESLNLNNTLQNKQTTRIFCLIVTTPQYFLSRTKAVNETWAPRCDRYFFVTEPPTGNVSSELMNFTKRLPIAPIQNLTPGYDHLTQKSNLAFLFTYENYLNDYDWFVKADDDTYLFVDHLKLFLSDKNTSEPVTYGYNYKTILEKGYHSGGGSYVLSRESLRRFHQAHHESPSKCQRDGGSEDIEVARCLRTKGVYPGKSLDKQNRELFHPLTFNDHFHGKFPHWLTFYAENHLQTGYNCCSEQTISFHYVHPAEQYLMDFLLYRARSKRLLNR